MPAIKTFPMTNKTSGTEIDAELNAAGIGKDGLAGWQCTRAFNWWVVRSDLGHGLNLRKARKLHEDHGKHLLPHGQPRVKDVSEFANTKGQLTLYHAKSPSALKALVDAIKTRP